MTKRFLLAVMFCGLLGCAPASSPSGPNPSTLETVATPVRVSDEVPLRVKITQTTALGLVNVARTTFTARPYSETVLNAALEAQNKPGPKPAFTAPSPNPAAEKYAKTDQAQINCLTELDNKQAAGLIELSDAERTDFASGKSCQVLLSKDQKAWEAQKLESEKSLIIWQSTAWKGKSEEIARISGARRPVSWTTNLDGEANIQLTPGQWFVTGEASSEFGTWDELAITVSTSDKLLTIANKFATLN